MVLCVVSVKVSDNKFALLCITISDISFVKVSAAENRQRSSVLFLQHIFNGMYVVSNLCLKFSIIA